MEGRSNTAMAVLCDFRIIRPAHEASYETSVKWLSEAHTRSEETMQAGKSFDREAFLERMRKFIARFGCGPENLASRGHDVPDFLHLRWDEMRIFNLGARPRGACMDERMRFFSEVVDAVTGRFYSDGDSPPDEIIHVSCTGYASPSAAQKLVVGRGWQKTTGVTHAYHMGCYASMPALKVGVGFLHSSSFRGKDELRVDIVHNELCTLHLNPSLHAPEQLVVQSLFADGHIKYSLIPGGGDVKTLKGLQLIAISEEIIPGTLDSMTWFLGEFGMQMTLSREVPDILSAALGGFLIGMFSEAGLDYRTLKDTAVFAVHPGGPRIIDTVSRMLELEPLQVAASRKVLRACGNMSSATLPHVWQDILEDRSIASGTWIVSMAFGPGLTIFGCLLRKL